MLSAIISTICIVIIGVVLGFTLANHNQGDKISFKEALDLTNLPVITFYNGKKRLNFLLDTGATDNIIDSRVLKSIDYTHNDDLVRISGIENNKKLCNTVNIHFYNNKREYDAVFCANNTIGAAFDEIKSSYGVIVNGILGVDFFNKYKYIIDFNQYVAYSKK